MEVLIVVKPADLRNECIVTEASGGARNLLENCAGLSAGQNVLVLLEDRRTGYYSATLADAFEQAAAQMQLRAKVLEVPFFAEDPAISDELAEMMRAADATVFLARLGDQLRFSDRLASVSPVVCYALDEEMLGSAFGTTTYGALVELKALVNTALSKASRIRVTCPLGTDFSGPGAVFPDDAGEVTVRRFPMSVFAPVPASPYRGRIAQAGFLVGTGSLYYQPYMRRLEDILTIRFEDGRITGFEGSEADMSAAQDHYRHVAERFGLDGSFVHSWHAGIHPGCSFRQPAGDNPERWSGAAFGNPRLLHFHTCGAYAPGEISLNIVDPTVTLDGIDVWENGRLHPERIDGGAQLLARHRELASLFANPAPENGLGPAGRLSGD